jgi:peptidylprolyl isomerase
MRGPEKAFPSIRAMRTRNLIACGLAALSLVAAGCGEEETDEAARDSAADQQETTEATPQPEAAPDARPKPKVAKPKGSPPKKLVIEDLDKGEGPAAKAGDQIEVNYVGVTFKDGKEFDSSFDAGQPFQFELGAGMVIPGWDQGVKGMKVGGRRRLTIPPALAYGEEGSPPAIGPDETLVFVIDLLRKG